MSQLVFVLALFVAGPIHATMGGSLLINSNSTEAKLLVSEGSVDGELSRLFDQMRIEAVGTATKKTKSFRMSNERLSFVCNKAFPAGNPPSTSCTFVIKAGSDTGDIRTFISKTGGRKVAILGMTQVFSRELEGVFPVDSSGLTDYLLMIENGVSLEAKGSSRGLFSIGFAGQ